MDRCARSSEGSGERAGSLGAPDGLRQLNLTECATASGSSGICRFRVNFGAICLQLLQQFQRKATARPFDPILKTPLTPPNLSTVICHACCDDGK